MHTNVFFWEECFVINKLCLSIDYDQSKSVYLLPVAHYQTIVVFFTFINKNGLLILAKDIIWKHKNLQKHILSRITTRLEIIYSYSKTNILPGSLPCSNWNSVYYKPSLFVVYTYYYNIHPTFQDLRHTLPLHLSENQTI